MDEMRSENADGEATGPGVNEKLYSDQQRPFTVLEQKWHEAPLH